MSRLPERNRRSPDYHYRQIDKKKRSSFSAFVYARYQIELQLIAKYLNSRKEKETKILDIGCGDGVILYLINQKFKNYPLHLYGLDPSNIALDVAKKKIPYAIFNKADAYNLPFDNNSFDLIISFDVIEHISEPKKMLQEIKRVGTKSSNYIIGTPIRFTEVPLGKDHYHEFFPIEFCELLGEFFEAPKLIQSHKLGLFLFYEKTSTIFRRKIQNYFLF